MLLANDVKRKTNHRLRRRLAQPEWARAAGRFENVGELEGGDAREDPEQLAGRLQRYVHLQNDVIASAYPKLPGEQAEEAFFARARVLARLGLEGNNTGAFA